MITNLHKFLTKCRWKNLIQNISTKYGGLLNILCWSWCDTGIIMCREYKHGLAAAGANSCRRVVRGNKDLCKLGKEYLNDLLCKFGPFCLQHSKTFDMSHAFLRVTVAELSELKQVRFLAHLVDVQMRHNCVKTFRIRRVNVTCDL